MELFFEKNKLKSAKNEIKKQRCFSNTTSSFILIYLWSNKYYEIK